ncbi:hypothetical protein B0H14DRAFT_3148667 [Mycena olivaceomarginata]|nr:hypothetical protein B0H14DRAFT_3148667 [Mycena olivaceomarginata]
MDQIATFQTSLPRALNTSLQKTPAGVVNAAKKSAQIKALEKAVPGIGKGMTRVQEMKDAREQGKKIKIVVSFAIVEDGKKPALVPSVRLVHNAQEDLQIFDVLGTVISLVQEAYSKECQAVRITRNIVSFYAVETVSKYYNLPKNCLSDGTVSDLLLHFYEQQHITKPQYEAKKLEMMLAVKREQLFPDSGAFQRRISSSVPSSSKSARSSLRASSRESSGGTLSRTSAISGDRESSSQKSRNVRLSAWRKPAATSRFARNPPALIEYRFRRFAVQVVGTDVLISMPQDAPIEKILVASDWKAGLSLSSNKNTVQEVHKTGFIGRGSSKNVVYARIGNDEYALGQSHDLALPPTENARMLREEFTNIHLAEAIREEFFTTALECEVNVPDFRFNVDGAVGVLEPLEPGHISASLALPFNDFITTRYLPCSPVDKAIQKFTGNGNCGNPPDRNDALTAAIHAFTHFTVLYTGEALVFCDLQGLFNRQGTMTLIDPQSHSSESDSTQTHVLGRRSQRNQAFSEPPLRGLRQKLHLPQDYSFFNEMVEKQCNIPE